MQTSPAIRQENMMVYQQVPKFAMPGEPILCLGIDEKPIRYFCLRSLAFSEVDGRILHYTDKSMLMQWSKDTKEFYGISGKVWGEEKTHRLREFSTRKGATWLLCRYSPEVLGWIESLGSIVWKDDRYAMIRLIGA